MDEHVEGNGDAVESGEESTAEDPQRTNMMSGMTEQAPQLATLNLGPSASLEARIEEAVEHGFQSARDNRLTQVERELDELKERLAASELARSEPGETLSKRPMARPSHVVQPLGSGLPLASDLRAEYEQRVRGLQPGDVGSLVEIKREFRRKGLEVY